MIRSALFIALKMTNHKLGNSLLGVVIHSVVVHTIFILLIASSYETNDSNSFHVNTNISSKPPVVIPSIENHTATLIFLHGSGDVGDEWSSKMERVRDPCMKIICPLADEMPISWHGSLNFTGWFDFKSRRYPHDECDYNGLARAANYVHALIEKEIKEGIKPIRIVVAGISQGALVALQAGVSFRSRLGAIVQLNPWSPEYKMLNPDNPVSNKHIPVFIGHVANDKYMTDRSAKVLADQIKHSFSATTHFKIYNDHVYHETTDEEMDDLKKFIKTYVISI